MKFRFLTLFILLLVSRFSFASPYNNDSSDPQPCNVSEANQSLLLLQNSTTCVDGVAGGVFSSEGNRTAANTLSNDLRTKGAGGEDVSFLGESNMKGLAAGDHFSGWGVWATTSYVDYDGDNNLTRTANAVSKVVYDADTKSVLFGADRFVTDRMVMGISAGYEYTEVFTLFNGGNTHTDGFTIAPYAAYLINDNFSVDAAVGYSSLETDADRLELGTGSTLLSDYDSDRWFVSTNLNAATAYNDFYLSGRVGWLYSAEEQDGYTETGSTGGAGNRTVGDRDVWISQIIVGGEAAYNNGRTEPYIGAAYVHDLSRGLGTGAGGLPGGVAAIYDDDDEVQLSAGLRIYGDRFTAVLDFSHTVSRNNFDSTSGMLTIRTDL